MKTEKKNYNRVKKKQMINTSRSIKYDQENLKLSSGKWNSSSNLAIMREMKEWEVMELYLGRNKREHLVKDIVHICFSRLTVLDINRNCISSVEALTCANMPSLLELYISWNQIMKIQELKKARWPQLNHLDFVSNHVRDGQILTQAHFLFLNELWIEETQLQEPIANIFDLRCMCKMETSRMKTIGFKNNLQKSIRKCFAMKWEKIAMLDQ